MLQYILFLELGTYVLKKKKCLQQTKTLKFYMFILKNIGDHVQYSLKICPTTDIPETK